MNPTPQAAVMSTSQFYCCPMKAVAIGLLLALGLGLACQPQPTATPTPTGAPTAPTATPAIAPTPVPQPTPTTVLQPTPSPPPGPSEAVLSLSILEPAPESVVRHPQLPVKGTTSADAVVSVNGRVVPVDAAGAFATTVSLQAGPNIIEVVASDFAGHQQSAILSAIYIPQ